MQTIKYWKLIFGRTIKRSWVFGSRGEIVAKLLILVVAFIGLSYCLQGQIANEQVIWSIAAVGACGVLFILLVAYNLLLIPAERDLEQQMQITELEGKLHPPRWDYLREATRFLCRAYDAGSVFVPLEQLKTEFSVYRHDLIVLKSMSVIEYGVDGHLYLQDRSQSSMIGLSDTGRQWATDTFGFDRRLGY